MFNSYCLGLFIRFGIGRLGSRWQVLFLLFTLLMTKTSWSIAYYLLTICTGCSAALYSLSDCSEACCIDYSDVCIQLLWSFIDEILLCEASLYIYSIVFCPCAVSNTIDSIVLTYPGNRPWSPGTLYSALSLGSVQGSWAVVTKE